MILELNPNGNKCSESDYINASHIDVCCFEIIDIINKYINEYNLFILFNSCCS